MLDIVCLHSYLHKHHLHRGLPLFCAPTPGIKTDRDPTLAAIGEPMLSDCNVHELPSQKDDRQSRMALAAMVEYLEAET